MRFDGKGSTPLLHQELKNYTNYAPKSGVKACESVRKRGHAWKMAISGAVENKGLHGLE